ncbi:unnamed protein product [Microthlaspi erraticum]|uniref:TFIIS central domain-containing protein n=1 Tax=Microthlaspi erraticum TaxID=1685480 RepID=A0A6D2HSL4_9BRAS|nr:unnamed protein product [Microthlaspi erraticum]CAA7022664.1 unnamed protein product [Microthlaspi erraticum]
MKKQEFLELFEAAIRAAKTAREKTNSSPQVARCVDAMNRLKEVPESLALDVLLTTSSLGENLTRVCVEHRNPQIRSDAKNLLNTWMRYLYGSRPKRSRRDEVRDRRDDRDQNLVKMMSTGDSKRDKVREILQKSLSKVADEVHVEMKKRVTDCDSWDVAVSVESAMFEKLGCFEGPQKPKYRSILFNIGDSNNPDLRRKVLTGEINGERLMTMKREEMGSDKIQKEVKAIKEKAARYKEEN